MAEMLKTIYIMHTTSKKEEAGTDARFRLSASRSQIDWSKDFPDNKDVNERQSGTSNEYKFDVSGEEIAEDTQLTLHMVTTDDAWLPATMWAIGETESGEFRVLAHHSKWGLGWFDRGSKNVPDSHDSYLITH